MSQNTATDPNVVDSADYSLHMPLSSETSDTADASTASNTSAGEMKPSSHETGGFSIDSYADRLMDELFEDVEGALERGANLPAEPAKPDYISLQTLSMPKLAIPSFLMPRQPQEEEDPDLESLTQLAINDPQQRRGMGKSVDKLLLAAAGVSVLATAALWFAFQRGWQPPTMFSAAKPTANSAATQATGDVEFSQYMMRSLEIISSKAQNAQRYSSGSSAQPNALANNPPAGANLPPIGNTLPPVAVNGTPAQPAASATVPERVYIPVYQPPQPGTVTATQPIQPSQPNVVAPAAAPTTAAAPSRGTIPNIAPNGTHTLVGVLSGSNPVALFEVNDTVQRISPGESIGASGWTLVSVDGDQAIVRRNGEVRSILAGQRF